jgi:hypothetical protein
VGCSLSIVRRSSPVVGCTGREEKESEERRSAS